MVTILGSPKKHGLYGKMSILVQDIPLCLKNNIKMK